MNPNVLIIDDNDDDVLMIKRGFAKSKTANQLHWVANGQEALDFLQSENAASIQIILLDLNMEIMNGFEFLTERKKLSKNSRIPVIVLSSSTRPSDVEKAYSLGANSYVEKPFDPQKFIDTILNIENFWISVTKSP